MKKQRLILYLVILLCFSLIKPTPIRAEEWTAEQKEIVDWFKKYAEVSIEGNLEGIWSYYHPKFSGWDYSKIMNEGVPFDKA
jgi:hypothetical protein